MRIFTIITLSFFINLISILLLFSESSKGNAFTASGFFSNFSTKFAYALPVTIIPTLIYITIGFRITKDLTVRKHILWGIALIPILMIFDVLFLTGAFTSITDIEATIVIKNRIKTGVVYVVCMLIMEQQTNWSG